METIKLKVTAIKKVEIGKINCFLQMYKWKDVEYEFPFFPSIAFKKYKCRIEKLRITSCAPVYHLVFAWMIWRLVFYWET